jgi:hypothetical protein
LIDRKKIEKISVDRKEIEKISLESQSIESFDSIRIDLFRSIDNHLTNQAVRVVFFIYTFLLFKEKSKDEKLKMFVRKRAFDWFRPFFLRQSKKN